MAIFRQNQCFSSIQYNQLLEKIRIFSSLVQSSYGLENYFQSSLVQLEAKKFILVQYQLVLEFKLFLVQYQSSILVKFCHHYRSLIAVGIFHGNPTLTRVHRTNFNRFKKLHEDYVDLIDEIDNLQILLYNCFLRIYF